MANRIYKYVFFGLLIFFLAGAAYFYISERKHDDEIRKLTNAISIQAETIEISKDVYEKQSVEIKTLNGLLKTSSEANKRMLEEIEKRELKIASLNQLVVYWKKAYEGAVEATEEEEGEVSPDCQVECSKVRTKVTFQKDFGFIRVDGHTLTHPPEGFVKVEQVRPLRLTLAVVQDSAKKWSAIVSSSEENVGVNIELSSVDPFINKQKWYQKIGVGTTVAVGQGLMSSVSATYQIGNFDIGPVYGFYSNDSVEKFFGLTANWKPFR